MGNQFGFLPVSVPELNGKECFNPIQFVYTTQKIIKQKKESAAVFLTSRLLKTVRRYRGPEENDPTLMGRDKKSDAREMQSFYQHYYKKYIQAFQKAANKADRAQLTKAYQTANILFEVLKAVNQMQSVEVDREILEAHDKVVEKTQIYIPYNILPLDPDSADQAIMRYPEIQVAVYALCGLPWPRDYKKKKDEDLLDWLQAMFGFQKDSVANQMEHLI